MKREIFKNSKKQELQKRKKSYKRSESTSNRRKRESILPSSKPKFEELYIQLVKLDKQIGFCIQNWLSIQQGINNLPRNQRSELLFPKFRDGMKFQEELCQNLCKKQRKILQTFFEEMRQQNPHQKLQEIYSSKPIQLKKAFLNQFMLEEDKEKKEKREEDDDQEEEEEEEEGEYEEEESEEGEY